MKRKKIVAGNWKMNMTHDESVNLIEELKQISTNYVDIKIPRERVILGDININLDEEDEGKGFYRE